MPIQRVQFINLLLLAFVKSRKLVPFLICYNFFGTIKKSLACPDVGSIFFKRSKFCYNFGEKFTKLYTFVNLNVKIFKQKSSFFEALKIDKYCKSI